jgi:hypothetical protein
MKKWFSGIGLFVSGLIMGAGICNACERIIWHGSLWQGLLATGIGMMAGIISFQSLYHENLIK